MRVLGFNFRRLQIFVVSVDDVVVGDVVVDVVVDVVASVDIVVGVVYVNE